MADDDKDKGKEPPAPTSDTSAGTPSTPADGSKKGEAEILSGLIDGMIGCLGTLKSSSFSEVELKELGIASSLKNLPCTFDICLTQNVGANEETTRIRRGVKHVLKKRFSSEGRGGKVYSREKYLTYVDVGIEHCVKPSKQGSMLCRAGFVVLVTVVVLAAAVGTVILVNKFSASKQGVEISHSVVHMLNGTTNLSQKVVVNIQGEVERK